MITKLELDENFDFSNEEVGFSLSPSSAKYELDTYGGILMNVPMVMSGIKKDSSPKSSYIQTYGSITFKNATECKPPIKHTLQSVNYMTVHPKRASDRSYVIDRWYHRVYLYKYRIFYDLERMLRPQFEIIR